MLAEIIQRPSLCYKMKSNEGENKENFRKGFKTQVLEVSNKTEHTVQILAKHCQLSNLMNIKIEILDMKKNNDFETELEPGKC